MQFILRVVLASAEYIKNKPDPDPIQDCCPEHSTKDQQ
jgi:hypothetical protein